MFYKISQISFQLTALRLKIRCDINVQLTRMLTLFRAEFQVQTIRVDLTSKAT